MERENRNHPGMEGFLPASAPLANPYVPFQPENPPKYEARKGLIRGTIFPGLDLPFLGMVNRNEKPVTPLSELQVMAFAIQELALYLDTHRDDREALEIYRAYQKAYQDAAIIISQYGGPDGELGASLRYLSQRYSMPFDELKGLLTDVGIGTSK